MSNRPSTFGGTWTRPDQSGIGRSQRELQDQASFDHGPAAGASCLLILAVPLGLAVLAALISTTGVIA